MHTATDSVKRAQEGVLEMLLANHPLDCPVCDKGGECPLQDQAFSHGPGESRYVEEKRHFEKPIPISDLVLLDRERCILCDRCTRFADEVAGDKLIHFVSRGNDTQVMTFPDEPFASYFTGNTVQICPVGALTATPYRFKARPWDLEQVESTCTTCSVGCRVVIQSSRDELVRYQGVDSDPVNWGWLCDRGRFDFEAVNTDERLGAPLVRGESGLAETSWNGALGDRRGARARGPRRRWAGCDRSARRWPWHERGRVRVGQARRRPRHRPSATPRWATGCRRPCSGSIGRPSTRRRTRRRSCCSAPTSKRSCRCCTSGCATPPRSAAAGSSSSRRSSRASRRWRGRACGTSRAGQPRVIGATLAEPDDGGTTGQGQCRRRRRACQPRRVAGVGGRLVGGPARRRSPGAKVLPALRRGNVVGALELGLRPPAGDGPDDGRRRRLERPAGGGRGQARPARAARRRSAQRLPRRRSRPAGAGRRPPGDVDRHVPERLQRPRRRRARGGGVRREVGHDDQPRGSGHDGRPEDHARPAPPVPTG